ncbi:MAG TPA: STAS domain-containing protein [Burkholderiaceae bacterium]|nr:STAS domain-containing protein [Burkholderiaceae bacterium]HQR70399.1 STAS domain-containing protein [Burkholderiaceae bacterium]
MRVDESSLGMSNAAQVAELGRAAIEHGDAAFDLSAVARCDSSAVAVLLEWQRAASAKGLRLQVVGAPPGLVSLATVYGVEGLLPALATGR